MITLDMRNQTCPIPVIETKKQLDISDEMICTIVDNEIAVENIKKMASDIGATAKVTETDKDLFYIYITKNSDTIINDVQLNDVLVINSESMGEDKELGKTLIQACIHTLCDIDNIPQKIIFYNSGVKLFTNEQISNDLISLKNLGTEIILCGACVQHYDINQDIGRISNMYEIMQTITSAKKVMYI